VVAPIESMDLKIRIGGWVSNVEACSSTYHTRRLCSFFPFLLGLETVASFYAKIYCYNAVDFVKAVLELEYSVGTSNFSK
jgi:hypothetical protein